MLDGIIILNFFPDNTFITLKSGHFEDKSNSDALGSMLMATKNNIVFSPRNSKPFTDQMLLNIVLFLEPEMGPKKHNNSSMSFKSHLFKVLNSR